MNIEQKTHVDRVSKAIFRKTAPNVDVEKLADIFHKCALSSFLAGDMPMVHGRVDSRWFLSREVIDWVRNEAWTMHTTLPQFRDLRTQLPLVKGSAPPARRR